MTIIEVGKEFMGVKVDKIKIGTSGNNKDIEILYIDNFNNFEYAYVSNEGGSSYHSPSTGPEHYLNIVYRNKTYLLKCDNPKSLFDIITKQKIREDKLDKLIQEDESIDL